MKIETFESARAVPFYIKHSVPLAADMSAPDSELELELVGDTLIVFLPKALPVLLRIKVLPILSVSKLISEVLSHFFAKMTDFFLVSVR